MPLKSGMLMMTGGMEHTWFDTNAILPDSGNPFPDELWKIRLGTQYVRRYNNGWTGMLGTSIGSSTDVPFDAARDLLFTVMGMLSVPHHERN